MNGGSSAEAEAVVYDNVSAPAAAKHRFAMRCILSLLEASGWRPVVVKRPPLVAAAYAGAPPRTRTYCSLTARLWALRHTNAGGTFFERRRSSRRSPTC